MYVNKYYVNIVLTNKITLKDKHSNNYIDFLHYTYIVQPLVKYVRILRYILFLFVYITIIALIIKVQKFMLTIR